MIEVNMMELISDRTKEEEVIEGMQESRFQSEAYTHIPIVQTTTVMTTQMSIVMTIQQMTTQMNIRQVTSEDNHADDHSLEAGTVTQTRILNMTSIYGFH
ncbi:MAG: hypothetical protein ACLT33_04735 [Lachnospira pectinoschiza]